MASRSNLSRVFDRLESAGLKLKSKKCNLFAQQVEFLGHKVSADGISTSPAKTQVVHNWPTPCNVSELRSFLGLCSYYRKFVKNFAAIAKPLHDLTAKDKNFKWSEECQNAFQKLKAALTTDPILAHPDFTRDFILDTDASDKSIGAVLSQNIDGKERVCAYASRCLSKSERRYCVTRKELLAVTHFVKHFKHYLYGKEFLVRTDHSSLRWLMQFKNPEGQFARWIDVLSIYNFKVQHRPGRLHANADAMSRLPCKQCGYNDKWENDNVSRIVEHEGADQSLQSSQKADNDLQKLRTWIEQGVRPKKVSVSGESFYLKSLVSQFDRLCIEDDLICRKWEDISTNQIFHQYVVPYSKRRSVLQQCHDEKTAGHLGIKKTLHKIRLRYYWPGLQRDVRQYIAGCERCAKRKSDNVTKRAPMKIVPTGYPMERIATDILGELPLTKNGNKHILVVADYFTKWTESFAMPNMESRTVAKILVEEVISRFGVPAVLHSDQGRQFESKLFMEMCSLLGITKTHTTPYHPQSDGMVERFNRTLTTMLSNFVNENHNDWDKHLQYVMMAYRSTIHETTGFSPNALMLGREVCTPLDILYEVPSSIKPTPQDKCV